MNISPEQPVARIARQYYHDQPYRQHHQERDHRREASLPELQRILAAFIHAQCSLSDFAHALHAHLRTTEDWRATGFWMMTLKQLGTYHGEEAETRFRNIIRGLNASTAGERIEQCYRFLKQERERLKDQRTHRQLAAPGKSAFLVSLLAAWLDPAGQVFIVWPNTQKGLAVLLNVGAIPSPLAKAIKRNTSITTAQDYAALLDVVHWLAPIVHPQPDGLRWWAERFLDWVYMHQDDIRIWLATGNHRGIAEAPVAYTVSGVPSGTPPTTAPPVPFPTDTPLLPIPVERLNERIQSLRRRLLVPEAVLRRIYHALVLGHHVILCGPPGTGKTDLACLLPRELWYGEQASGGYATHLVTATDEWTPRHVIGGIAPATRDGLVHYTIEYGCLSRTIMENWDLDHERPEQWANATRRRVVLVRGDANEPCLGCWLVIDELNRAPIDMAFGEALTAIGGRVMTLLVPTMHGNVPLPVPQDFRIIGTLNTFDRHFLHQMSEALKRRFAFIELLPPPRQQRQAEQATVLCRVLTHLQPSSGGHIGADGLRWPGVIEIREGDTTPWLCQWETETAVQHCFDEGWRLFEVIRLYRQLGTAQAIGWVTAYLGAGLLDTLRLDDEDGWHTCLDTAVADTLADQLHILFPDEIEALLIFLRTGDTDAFALCYGRMLAEVTNPRRRMAHMHALHSARDEQGQPYLSFEDARTVAADEKKAVPVDVLSRLFHTAQPRRQLLLFEERLERFLFERTI